MKKASKMFTVILALVMCLTLGLTVGCAQDTPETTTYSVSLPTGLTGGSVTADKTKVDEGGTVVITASPQTSYELDWIKINNKDQTKTSDNRYEVKNVRENVTVTAAFKASAVVENPMFTSFPDDRFINSYEDLTFYVNAEGEQTHRSDLPTVEDGTQLGILVTMKSGSLDEMLEFFADNPQYTKPGYVKTTYSENGFNEGILTDVSNGIYMKPNCAYEISYTASKNGKTETRVQTIFVAKSYDLVSDMFGPVFDETATVMNMEIVDAPTAMFGEDKVLKLHNPDGAAETSGFFEKEGIYLGTKNPADFQFVFYNDSDAEVIIACKGGSNPIDPILAPHSYMIWNPYSRPYYQEGEYADSIFERHGYIDRKTGELQMLQFTVLPTDPTMAEATVYIGGLRGTATPYTEFANFPEDRIISSEEMSDPYGVTYYVNEGGEEEFRSDFPTAKTATTEITAKVTARQFRAFVLGNNAIQPPSVAADQFDNGVLEDISKGILMTPGYAYYIEYTAELADGAKESRTQTVILWDMEQKISDAFVGATLSLANGEGKISVESACSAILGSKMLNVTFGEHSPDPAGMKLQAWYEKAGVKMEGTKDTQRLEFLIYNPNDFAINMFNVVGVNSNWAYAAVEPHTYMLWDPYTIPGNGSDVPPYSHFLWTDGLITDSNELGRIGFYIQAVDGAAGNLYIGEFMATQPAVEPAA